MFGSRDHYGTYLVCGNEVEACAEDFEPLTRDEVYGLVLERLQEEDDLKEDPTALEILPHELLTNLTTIHARHTAMIVNSSF